MKKHLILITVMLAQPAVFASAAEQDVLKHYADLAHAVYSDSLMTAKELQTAVNTLIAEPTEANLMVARAAWKASRVPYQQSEVYRFGNAIVDDWEGKVNAWPLDEGLIDYVDAGYGETSDENPAYRANVIANEKFTFSGQDVDASEITKELLADTLHELGGVEANVATGYHAIEFLLWGQDLHGTDAGHGERKASDFDTESCAVGNCDRRAAYLRVATDLLVDDLTWMRAQWAEGGEARAQVLSDTTTGLTAMVTGMGSLSYGELAGERMQLGLLLHDPEEEHDCFSDNTHNSHYYNAMGIRNVYLGEYTRIDGSVFKGPSLSALVSNATEDTDTDLRVALDATMAAMTAMMMRAEGGMEAYDQMLGAENDEGNAVVQKAIDSLTAQTQKIEMVVAALDLDLIRFEGSDSLDNPKAVFE